MYTVEWANGRRMTRWRLLGDAIDSVVHTLHSPEEAVVQPAGLDGLILVWEAADDAYEYSGAHAVAVIRAHPPVAVADELKVTWSPQ